MICSYSYMKLIWIVASWVVSSSKSAQSFSSKMLWSKLVIILFLVSSTWNSILASARLLCISSSFSCSTFVSGSRSGSYLLNRLQYSCISSFILVIEGAEKLPFGLLPNFLSYFSKFSKDSFSFKLSNSGSSSSPWYSLINLKVFVLNPIAP